MTLEELYSIEKSRIRKLALRYARMFNTEVEDLVQEGALAVVEMHNSYSAKLNDEELLRVSHRVINRKIYRYAKNEYRQQENKKDYPQCNE